MSESDQNVIMKLKKIRLVSTRSSRDHMCSMLLLQSFLKEKLLLKFEATKSATAYNMLKRGLLYIIVVIFFIYSDIVLICLHTYLKEMLNKHLIG